MQTQTQTLIKPFLLLFLLLPGCGDDGAGDRTLWVTMAELESPTLAEADALCQDEGRSGGMGQSLALVPYADRHNGDGRIVSSLQAELSDGVVELWGEGPGAPVLTVLGDERTRAWGESECTGEMGVAGTPSGGPAWLTGQLVGCDRRLPVFCLENGVKQGETGLVLQKPLG